MSLNSLEIDTPRAGTKDRSALRGVCPTGKDDVEKPPPPNRSVANPGILSPLVDDINSTGNRGSARGRFSMTVELEIVAVTETKYDICRNIYKD